MDDDMQSYLQQVAAGASEEAFMELALEMLADLGVEDPAQTARTLWASVEHEEEEASEPELRVLTAAQLAAAPSRAAGAQAAEEEAQSAPQPHAAAHAQTAPAQTAPAPAPAPASPETAQATAQETAQEETTREKGKKKGKNARRKAKGTVKHTGPGGVTAEAAAAAANMAAVGGANGVVAGTASAALTAAAVSELNDLDDWASAWEEAKRTGREWGGRGFGGRAAHRATYQPRDVNLEGVTMAFHGVDLLDRTTLRLVDGHRYGLIGRNGCGKSTLLRRIATQTLPGFPLHIRVALVAQEIDGTELNAVESVLAAHTEMVSLQAEAAAIEGSTPTAQDEADADAPPAPPGLERQSSTDRLVAIYDRLQELDVDSAPGRAEAILKGLNFSDAKRAMPTSQLSGGWRMRVALACALFIKPQLLMLDEPSNHLDLEATVWLQDYLQSYEGTVIIVSHDRQFLDQVCTDIIFFHLRQLHYYSGNYQAFQFVRDQALLKRTREATNLEQKKQHLRDTIKRMETAARGKGGDQKKANQVASRRKKLGRTGLEKDANGNRFRCQYASTGGIRIGADNQNDGGWDAQGNRTSAGIMEPPDPEVKFMLPACEPLPVAGDYFRLTDVSFTYPGDEKPIFKEVTCSVGPGDRVALVGANGAGKTTFLNVLNGELPSSHGEVWRQPTARVSYFSQHHVDQLDLSMTPLQHMAAAFDNPPEQVLRGHLSKFGVTAALAVKPMSALSGGQKSRVVFAQITFRPPHVLLLDEPTNHLDYQSIDALLEALKAFEGAIVFVSHDQNLLAEVAEELWVVRRRRVTRWPGDWESYRADLLERVRAAAST